MKYCWFLILVYLSACTTFMEKDRQKETTEIVADGAVETSLSYQKVGKRYLDTLSNHICSATRLEFIDLYSPQDSIAEQDYLYLATFLRSKGFEVTKGGRGNWMEGPRMLSLVLENETCLCEVLKLYYTKNTNDLYPVTERLDCSPK